MITLYVLDVPEFAPLVTAASADSTCRVTGPRQGYWTIQAETGLTFRRKEMKMKPAIWYGAFTGGIDGVIAEFGQDLVRVLPVTAPQ
ncbi:MAG: hypothetical protein V4724_17810 [Pseudomonadota bacterium]